MYFRNIHITQEGKSLLLTVENSFLSDNIRQRFLANITTYFIEIDPTLQDVGIRADAEFLDTHSEETLKGVAIMKEQKKDEKKAERTGHKVEGIPAAKIKERYTLDNFVVWSHNQLAHAACEAVVRKPGGNYNPLFIYSDVGLGKTHLLQATANAIKAKHKGLKVLYTTVDRFVNEYVLSIKNRKIDQMRARFKSIDVLLLDDVQFLAGKKQTQEELYTIFNILYDAWKQIILSSDRSPRELTNIEPRLTSRFEWGIMIDLDVPDFETKMAILQQKAREREFILPQDTTEYIAYNLGANVRELEGILNQMIAEFELHGKNPTIENISARFERLNIRHEALWGARNATFGHEKFRTKSYKDVLKAVSEHFGIEEEDMLWAGRKKMFMQPRQVAMYLLKYKMRYTYERIGNIFDGRQHSAVMYACSKLEKDLKKDQTLMYEINTLKEKLGF